MSEEAQRPDPDALLATLKREESRLQGGRLRVFLGMCAGVGKTYAMLEAAAKARWEGADAVIGVVETHGRFETAALVDSLPVFPRRKVEHRGAELSEMDLDGLLARHPKLVLVDELAHSNVPGSKHPKRWQDVLELLDAGIDVYTTINVQHLESRKDSVEAITGVPVRETVPDSVLERADQVEVIDISPTELLERLGEGKVYLGDKARRAAENFSRPQPLTALREIALRYVAEQVDRQLAEINQGNGSKGAWHTNERVMVAVSPSAYSEHLVRAARRLAATLRAPWLAVYVDNGSELSPKQREQLRKNLGLAEELGAEVLSTADSDLAAALRRLAKSRNVSQLVLGRPRPRAWSSLLDGGSLLSRLTRERGDFDLHVVRMEDESGRGEGKRWGRWLASPAQYWYTLWVVAAMAGLGVPAGLLLGYKAVGFLFLLTVLGLSLFYSLGPVLFAAVLSALVWDYFFIPPRFTLTISTSEDVLMIVAYFLAAVTTGLLTHRLRRNQHVLEQRERRTELLYRLVSAFSGGDREALLTQVADLLSGALGRACGVFVAADGKLVNQGHSSQPFQLSEKELAVAAWALDARKAAGWSTQNLPSVAVLVTPLLGAREAVGLLAVRAGRGGPLGFDDEELLKAAARQLALSLERESLEERSRAADLLRESEQLHQALLNSVSHELRTPLTAMLGSAAALQDPGADADPGQRQALLADLAAGGERLNRVIENLLDMARLNSGVLGLKADWHDPAELVSMTVRSLKRPLAGHRVELALPDGLPLLRMDFRLMEHALSNLLLNAAAYAPVGTPIKVAASASAGRLELSVEDRGPGVPTEDLERVFDKFYRVPGSPTGGTGLGLYIARSLVQAHSGSVRVEKAAGGGARFVLSLPLEAAPQGPKDLP